MIINQSSLSILFQGFSAFFSKGLESAPPHHLDVAMKTPSGAREEVYPWLGQFPSMREWIGARVANNLAVHSFAIKNRDFESTIAVSRNDIEDDRYNVFGPILTEMGEAAGEHPNQLVFGLIAAGFATLCYDGQNFFDTEHPVGNQEGASVSVSNFQGGSGTPWYLFDTSRAIKPIIYQERKPVQFVKKDAASDDNVFFEKEYLYGADGRSNVGFGLWQLAYASKETLSAANYKAARAAMMAFRGENGRPLNIKPTLLVVPPSLEEEALQILNAETLSAGESNVWKGTAKLITTAWL